MNKLKIALYWAASCGGCDVAVLDINEKILDVAAVADIIFWPIAVDTKYKDIEALPDKSIDITFFNGAIRSSENEHVARILRDKSITLVAFGACACLGGIPGLSNVATKKNTYETVYKDSVSTENPNNIYPQPEYNSEDGELYIPKFYEHVYSLNQIVDVDYYVPGCPPPAELIAEGIAALTSLEAPPKGTIFGGRKALCHECPRVQSEDKVVKEFKRYWKVIPDQEKCLLEQGLVCCGPATRSGCGARCIKANVPCRGCFGPAEDVMDTGAKLLSAITSMIDTRDPKVAEKLSDQIDDPLGTFYRFGLPTSVFRRVKS